MIPYCPPPLPDQSDEDPGEIDFLDLCRILVRIDPPQPETAHQVVFIGGPRCGETIPYTDDLKPFVKTISPHRPIPRWDLLPETPGPQLLDLEVHVYRLDCIQWLAHERRGRAWVYVHDDADATVFA